MEGNRKKRRVRVLGAVAAAFLVALVAAGVLKWRMLTSHFVALYHRQTCNPTEISPEDVRSCPAACHLDDVPWIATREWYCAANSLSMIAAQHGVHAPTEHCSFLMGFSYGASAVPGSSVVQFFGEPEAGLGAAAPYVGLQRRYYTTDDATLYLNALRSALSQGYPVRVGLDVAVLYDLEEPSPHSEVLVGYDQDGFLYYETVCLPEAPCEPGEQPPGEEGLRISDQTLLEAVRGQAKIFSCPWRYSLTIFEERSRETDLGPIWARNGDLLVGGAKYGPAQGADAIEALANTFEKHGVKADVAEIAPPLGAAIYGRRDNAAHLREAFAGSTDVERAATLFDAAADHYETVFERLGDGLEDETEKHEIATALRVAAEAERQIGELFLSLGQ